MASSRSSAAVSRSDEDEMRAALQVAIAHICTSESGNDGAQITKSAIATLTELTYLYTTTSLANDLEAFSQHAGRRTITPEDVQLVARKNPDNLLSKLQDFAESALSTTATISAASVATITTIPLKKKSPPKRKNRLSPPKQKKQSPKSQRNKEMRERLLQCIDTDSDNTEIQEEGTPSVAIAAPIKSVWDFSDSEDSHEVAKENRKPAAQKRKAIVAPSDLGSSSSEEDLAQRYKKMKEKNNKEDLSNIADWSSDGDSDEF